MFTGTVVYLLYYSKKYHYLASQISAVQQPTLYMIRISDHLKALNIGLIEFFIIRNEFFKIFWCWKEMPYILRKITDFHEFLKTDPNFKGL